MSVSEDQNQSSGERLIFDLNATPDSSNESSNGLVGNLLVAQSGGPTAVINASIAGVIQEAGKHMDNIEEIYGGLNGIYGILHENLVDLNDEKARSIEELKHTPGAALGKRGGRCSCRGCDQGAPPGLCACARRRTGRARSQCAARGAAAGARGCGRERGRRQGHQKGGRDRAGGAGQGARDGERRG